MILKVKASKKMTDIIDVDEIYNFIGPEYRRPYVMANKLVKANHVFDVRLKFSQRGAKVEVFALCIPGSEPKGDPHIVRIKIEKKSPDSNRSIIGTCSCKAGIEGKCKHVTATLIKVEQMKPEELIAATCTDLPQLWGKQGERTNNEHLFQPVPVAEFCHIKKRKRRSEWEYSSKVNSDILSAVKEIIYKGVPSTSMLKKAEEGRGTSLPNTDGDHHVTFIPNYIMQNLSKCVFTDVCCDAEIMTCPDDIQNFYFSYVYVLPSDVAVIYSKTRAQDNITWRRERQIRITGTTAYHFKVETIKGWDKRCERLLFAEFAGNANTKYGKDHENDALKLFATMYPGVETDIAVGFCVNVSIPMFGFSPDGIHNHDTLLEVKCPIKGKTLRGTSLCAALNYLQKVDNTLVYSLKRNHTYYTQIQFGLAVLNLKICKFILYSNVDGVESIEILNVARDDKFCDFLIRTLYGRYVKFILPFLVENKDRLLLSQ